MIKLLGAFLYFYKSLQVILVSLFKSEFPPGFEEASLCNFGMTLGIRDSRKIIDQYGLTEQDVRNQARFDDTIGTFPEFLDV